MDIFKKIGLNWLFVLIVVVKIIKVEKQFPSQNYGFVKKIQRHPKLLSITVKKVKKKVKKQKKTFDR